MWIYGDREAEHDPVLALLEAERQWNAAEAEQNAITRHGARVAAFIDAAGVAQGLADAELAQSARHHSVGFERLTDTARAASALLRLLASAIRDGLQHSRLPFRDTASAFERLRFLAARHSRVTVREAEGFAYYGFYPESWLLAAQQSPLAAAGGSTHVIGLRSVGTALAAMVAAGLGGSFSPRGNDKVTVSTIRPVGHHFAREIHIGPDLESLWLSDPTARFAIVDEGPGLSGSSFGAVIDWLLARGVTRDRIHAFPSHDKPLGRASSERHRAQWDMISRYVLSMDQLWTTRQDDRALSRWFEDLTGRSEKPLINMSGGLWRDWVYSGSRSVARPASNVSQERLKFRLEAGGASWLIRFAGLGQHGATKFQRAKALADRGFAPRPLSFRHGMTLERWIDAVPLSLCPGYPRQKIVARLGDYLGFRAKTFTAQQETGATLERLLDMAVYNLGLGQEHRAAERIESMRSDILTLEPQVRRVSTDNRLQRHEWLVTPDGTLLKTDAVDHSSTHDMVGCQDIAWDIAGAVAEFDLSGTERDELEHIVGRSSGRTPCPALVDALIPLYLAFQFAAASLAIDTCPVTESQSLSMSARSYAQKLIRHFEEDGRIVRLTELAQ